MCGFCCTRFRGPQCHWSHFLPTYAPMDRTPTVYWFGRLTGFGVYTSEGGTGGERERERETCPNYEEISEPRHNSSRQTGDMQQVTYWGHTHVRRHGELLPGFLCISVCACVCTRTRASP